MDFLKRKGDSALVQSMERATTSSQSDGEKADAVDLDALRLSEMGYDQGLKRNFSVFSVLGVGFSLTNSWFAISVALVTGIASGGSVLVVYGIILIALLSICVGICLSELVSAMPNAGGQYYWVNRLAPPRYANFSSYLTGWISWAGALFTSASVSLALGSALVGCYQITHPDFVIQPWHVVVAYELSNVLCSLFNCYGRILPHVASAALYISLLSFFIIIIAVPASAKTHQSPRFVFAYFVNDTGWSNNGIAFIVGLINTNWAFACLDCATHLAEEVAHPEKMIPIAIMGTVAIGFVTAWTYAIAMFFSLTDIDALFSTPTYVPILQLFDQALNNAGGAAALEALIILTGLGCLVACHTWQSRMCWSFARDGGLPYSGYLAHVDARLQVPLRAHLLSSFVVALLGLLYLGSSTAFNSMVTASIVLLYISYAIPVLCLLIRGRHNIEHGPFWLGSGGGLFSNIVLLAWTAFTLVMYSFPSVMPVAADNMNYVSAVYGAVALIVTIDWFARGRKWYRAGAVSAGAVVEVVAAAAAAGGVETGSEARVGAAPEVVGLSDSEASDGGLRSRGL